MVAIPVVSLVFGSLPSRGAWIEIGVTPVSLIYLSGRSPRGERGLKSENFCKYYHGEGRSPRGERGLKFWRGINRRLRTGESLPSRGAWIEIVFPPAWLTGGQCRSPRGERGLKWQGGAEMIGMILSLPSRGAWIEIFDSSNQSANASVAPLAGSVD